MQQLAREEEQAYRRAHPVDCPPAHSGQDDINRELRRRRIRDELVDELAGLVGGAADAKE